MSHPSYSHEAVRVAVTLWDERDDDGRLRDLEPHEEAFLSAVHEARKIPDELNCAAALTDALGTYRAFDPDADADEATINILETAA